MRLTSLTILVVATTIAVAQPVSLAPHPVFDATTIATVRVFIHPDSLARILDPANADSEHEYPATVVFENELVRDSLVNVGFRLRGNTSRYSQKKSFKVSINAFESGRSFAGLEKLNLNGEHNDPSIVRAKVSWDLFRDAGIPASRAAHTRLYINGTYYGLYINVEHIDEQFVKVRYGNNDGPLYKCLWPADLTYRGADPNLYKFINDGHRAYELHITDEVDDYSDLARFIAVLNQTPDAAFADSIQRVLNVNSLLRVMAVDIAVGSWDDYWFLKNNYYLYHNTSTGLFEYIPYDYDNTFGIWWSSISSGIDWTTRNVYAWGHPSEPRPLMQRILRVAEFRARLTFYLRRLLQSVFTEAALHPRIDSLHTLITPAAESDTYRTLDYGFTVAQFHNSFTQPLGGHVTAGVKPFVTARRTSALSQLDPSNVPPILSGLGHAPAVTLPGAPVAVRVFVEDEATPTTVVFHGAIGDSSFASEMFDDGAHGDAAAGDGIYGTVVAAPPTGRTLTYHVEAFDVLAQMSREPYGSATRRIRGASPGPRLLLNEFMAKNAATILDVGNTPDDWVEIYNASPETLQLGQFTLTDNLSNPSKWRLPVHRMAPGEVLLIWADEEGAQGPMHANFKLDKDGEQLGIFYDGEGVPVACDTLTFGVQATDVSMGRMPDGGGWQFLPKPSPGQLNVTTGAEDLPDAAPRSFGLEPAYPNPFNPQTQIIYSVAGPNNVGRQNGSTHVRLAVLDLLGREVAVLVDGVQPSGQHHVIWNAGGERSGTYFVVLTSEGQRDVRRVVLIR